MGGKNSVGNSFLAGTIALAGVIGCGPKPEPKHPDKMDSKMASVVSTRPSMLAYNGTVGDLYYDIEAPETEVDYEELSEKYRRLRELANPKVDAEINHCNNLPEVKKISAEATEACNRAILNFEPLDAANCIALQQLISRKFAHCMESVYRKFIEDGDTR